MEVAAELYGSGASKAGPAKEVVVASIDGYALKTLKDHIALALDVAEAFEKKKSKSNFQTKCAKEVGSVKGSFTGPEADARPQRGP